jgi:hypothetical protein
VSPFAGSSAKNFVVPEEVAVPSNSRSCWPPKSVSRAAGVACTPVEKEGMSCVPPNAALRDQTSVPVRASKTLTSPSSVPMSNRQTPLNGATGERLCAGLPSERGFHVGGHSPPPVGARPRRIAWTTPSVLTVYTPSGPTVGGMTLTEAWPRRWPGE